jgi:serine/threonine protein kinase
MRVCPKCGHEAADDIIFCPKDGARLVGEEDSVEVARKRADPLVGATVSGRYKIVRRIGEGGMGVVYEAEHVALGKHVALKVLREDFTRKSDLVERFKQEARSASIIGHENIIDVSDFGETDAGGIFFAMELLRGEDLADVLQRETRLPLDRAARIITQMCRALHAAHQKGIIHRDMKPENVFLLQKDDRRDFVKVLDFGIAKMTTLDAEGRRLTQTGVIFGTPEYMAPEQARGQTLDLRVDVYATGIMLYEMLVGQVPFTGETFMAILTQHLFSEPKPIATLAPDLKIPPAVESVVLKAMSKDRDERYSTMLEMHDDLQRAISGAPVEARSSTLAPFEFRSPVPAAPLPRTPPGDGGTLREDTDTQGPALASRTRRPSRRMPVALLVALIGVGVAAAAVYLWRAGYFGPKSAAPPAARADAALVAVGETYFGLTAQHAEAAAADAAAVGQADASPPEARVDVAAAADASPDVEEAAIEADVGADEPDAGTDEGPDAGLEEAEVEAISDEGPEVEAEAGPAKLTLMIETEPPGAVLSDSRGRRLCRSLTPCTLEAPVGSLLLLHAEKGDWVGDDRFQVRSGTRTLTMILRRPVRPIRDAGTSAADAPLVWHPSP